MKANILLLAHVILLLSIFPSLDVFSQGSPPVMPSLEEDLKNLTLHVIAMFYMIENNFLRPHFLF